VESIRKRALRRSLLQVSRQCIMEEEAGELHAIAINEE
jgi:hypothetical protein